MRTRVELLARASPLGGGAGRTSLVVCRSEGILAARQTGSAEHGVAAGGLQVHLVGTGAGPLGGDDVEVVVTVGPGARLALRGVAATLALPDRDGRPARVHLRLRVEAGAVLDCALEPLVAVRGCDLHARLDVAVADGGVLDLTEAVVLGRWREAPGRWRGTLRADLLHDGRPHPWLRQSVALGPGAPAWDALDAPRVLLSRLRSPAALGQERPTLAPATTAPATTAPATSGTAVGCAVALPLAGGGELRQALGGDLIAVRRDLVALDALDHIAPPVSVDRNLVAS